MSGATGRNRRARHTAVVAEVDELWARRPDGSRREFADWASSSTYRSLLFSRLVGRPWPLEAWALCRPDSTPLFGAEDDEAGAGR